MRVMDVLRLLHSWEVVPMTVALRKVVQLFKIVVVQMIAYDTQVEVAVEAEITIRERVQQVRAVLLQVPL